MWDIVQRDSEQEENYVGYSSANYIVYGWWQEENSQGLFFSYIPDDPS